MTINHACATFCIQVPMLEMMAPETEEPEIAIGEGGRDAARIRDELRLQVW